MSCKAVRDIPSEIVDVAGSFACMGQRDIQIILAMKCWEVV
jgi:hypothetical protein